MFVLNGYTQEEAIKNLLSFAYQQRSQKVTTLSRIRSLAALFRMAPERDIQKIHPVAEAKTYLKALIYLCDFEDMHLQQTLKEFTECNKEGLARSLWKNYHSQPKVPLDFHSSSHTLEAHQSLLLSSFFCFFLGT